MLVGLLRTMRPHQWVKNLLFVLAPVVFAQALFDLDRVLGALAAVACFSLLASSIYILNDLVDVEADRAHPIKRNRPIASGAVSIPAARVAFVVLATVALGGGLWVHPLLALCLLGYFLNNLLYNFRIKRIAYLDVLSIAIGFELRVLAGSFAARVEPSAYLLIVTLLLALYLGLGKRMHELVQTEEAGTTKTRAVLQHYDKRVLSGLLWGTALATIATYVVYTLDPHTIATFHTPYLVLTSAFTLVGVFRFKHLVEHRPDAESPTEEMLRDIPFLVNLALWGVAVLLVIYLSWFVKL